MNWQELWEALGPEGRAVIAGLLASVIFDVMRRIPWVEACDKNAKRLAVALLAGVAGWIAGGTLPAIVAAALVAFGRHDLQEKRENTEPQEATAA